MKVAIYLRTSTDEQNPQNQLKDCLELLKSFKDTEHEIFEEKQSAWKEDTKREEFNRIKKLIKERKFDALIVWDLDRLYRNRKKLVAFFKFCKVYNCAVHSYRQDWLEQLHKIPDPFNEIMFDLMLQIMGWLAEEESIKKSQRVKASMKKNKQGKTISKYGKVWGKKPVSVKVQKQIIELRKQGKSYRDICKEVFYWDKSRNKHFVSMGYVHKVLNETPHKTS